MALTTAQTTALKSLVVDLLKQRGIDKGQHVRVLNKIKNEANKLNIPLAKRPFEEMLTQGMNSKIILELTNEEFEHLNTAMSKVPEKKAKAAKKEAVEVETASNLGNSDNPETSVAADPVEQADPIDPLGKEGTEPAEQSVSEEEALRADAKKLADVRAAIDSISPIVFEQLQKYTISKIIFLLKQEKNWEKVLEMAQAKKDKGDDAGSIGAAGDEGTVFDRVKLFVAMSIAKKLGLKIEELPADFNALMTQSLGRMQNKMEELAAEKKGVTKVETKKGEQKETEKKEQDFRKREEKLAKQEEALEAKAKAIAVDEKVLGAKAKELTASLDSGYENLNKARTQLNAEQEAFMAERKITAFIADPRNLRLPHLAGVVEGLGEEAKGYKVVRQEGGNALIKHNEEKICSVDQLSGAYRLIGSKDKLAELAVIAKILKQDCEIRGETDQPVAIVITGEQEEKAMLFDVAIKEGIKASQLYHVNKKGQKIHFSTEAVKAERAAVVKDVKAEERLGHEKRAAELVKSETVKKVLEEAAAKAAAKARPTATKTT